jgi:phosphoribosylamine--glycine ligase
MVERVLLVGGGGREHAIARAVAADCELFGCASNQNPGIAALTSEFRIVDETAPEEILEMAVDVDATLAVIGPESALEVGVADRLDEAGVYTFGPRAAEARIETDKAYQREFMRAEAISGCPDFETFETADAAADYVRQYDADVAVKPRGLTGGKGVRVTGDQVTQSEAVKYVREAGFDEWVVEERLVGEEFTIQAFVADGTVESTPAVQDHKRAYDGDEGPNTGGMGSYSAAGRTLPFMTDADYEAAVRILEETVEALPAYKGVLYGQFMLTADGPKVVEFNARFGDPEAMNTLPALETPLIEILTAARDEDSLPDVTFSGAATVCKYAVPDGYPTNPSAGTRIEVDENAAGEALLFYASVEARETGLYTTGSRAYAVVGNGAEISEAEQEAETALGSSSESIRVRHDIGTAESIQQRIDHMNRLRE